MRATVAMPVVGYLILLNDRLLHYAKLDPHFQMFVSESPVRLLLLYWGFFFLAVASAIYTWYCPHIIKRHESPAEYANSIREYLGSEANREQFAKILANRMRIPGRDEVLSETEVGALLHQFHYPPSAVNADRNSLAAAEWYVANIEHSWWRLIAAASFFFGFGFLSVPAIDTLLGCLSTPFA